MGHILQSCDSGCEDKNQVARVLSAALNILVYHKAIVLSNGEYRLNRTGLERLQRFMNRSRIKVSVQEEFDRLRIEYINSAFRGKKYSRITFKRAMPI